MHAGSGSCEEIQKQLPDNWGTEVLQGFKEVRQAVRGLNQLTEAFLPLAYLNQDLRMPHIQPAILRPFLESLPHLTTLHLWGGWKAFPDFRFKLPVVRVLTIIAFMDDDKDSLKDGLSYTHIVRVLRTVSNLRSLQLRLCRAERPWPAMLHRIKDEDPDLLAMAKRLEFDEGAGACRTRDPPGPADGSAPVARE